MQKGNAKEALTQKRKAVNVSGYISSFGYLK
jgi:hypothetical protein